MAKDNFRYAHERRDEIVWMSQNTNELPLSPKVEEALFEAVKSREYALYPHIKGVDNLPGLVLQDLGVSSEDGWQAELTHGGLEGLYVMHRALLGEGDEVIASDPSFLPIHHQIRLSGALPVEIPIYQPPWKLTADQVEKHVTDKTKMILLIDPLNPLGTQYTRDEVKAMAEVATRHDLLLVHDITYHDYAFEPTLAHEFAPDRTLYTYSFSKNAGFAGMRIGALVAKKEVMDRIRPYFVSGLGVNVLAQRAAKAALETKAEWVDRVVATARENQRVIKECVDKIPGLSIPVYPSSSNTVIIDVSERGINPDQMEDKLLYEHGVFIRSGTYLSKRFGERFVRVSFTVDPAGVKKFVDVLPQVVEELATK